MNKIRFQVLGAFTASSLLSLVLQSLFVSFLFDRGTGHLWLDLSVSLPLFCLVLAAALGGLVRYLGPLWSFAKSPGTADRGLVYRRLARLPRVLFTANLVLFLPVPLAAEGLKLLLGHPFPGWQDLMLITGLNLAFGFMSALQGLSWTEAITEPSRRALGLTDVDPAHPEMNLQTRLFLVNLASVLLSGLLASMAALGFYREVVTYYTGLAADAVTAATTVSAQAVNDNELKVVSQLFFLFLAVLAWTLALTFTSLGNVSRQLRTLRIRVAGMAEGSADLGRRAEVLYCDEVGLLTGRINAVMARMEAVVGAILSTSAQVVQSTGRVQASTRDAEGRLEAVVEARRQAEDALGGQGDALAATLEVAEELAASAESVKTVAEEQGLAVRQGAAAMEQLAASVTEVREMTVRAEGLATGLRQTSGQGGQSVEAVRRAMEAISAAAGAVAGTVASIKKIASQTNLLAMNAAIEAAHAGTSGLGFAVVAAEVRSLAENSSQGARAIGELMKDMAAKIAEGDRLATEAGAAFTRIYDLVVQTSEVMGTVARAMDQQQAGAATLVETTRTLQEAAARIGAVTGRQADHAEALNRSVQILVETGASMAMSQEVQGRAMTELTELVRHVAREVAGGSDAAERLGRDVEGFSVTGRAEASPR